MAESNPQSLTNEIKALSGNMAFITEFMDVEMYRMPHERPQTTGNSKDLPSPSVEKAEKLSHEVEQTISKSEKHPQNFEDEAYSLAESIKQPVVEMQAPPWKQKVVVLLPPEPSMKDISFLNKILGAVKLRDEEVLVREGQWKAKELIAFDGAKIILSFAAVEDFVPDHKLRSKQITVILTGSLNTMETDIQQKKMLWASLQQFFR
ncbi:MAG: hypothetical protein ACK417_00655 [Bacteroidia bacterium]